MNIISNDGYLILNSHLNSDIDEEFEIIESLATSHHDSFSSQVKSEMKYYEITFEGLAKSINITNFRLGALLNGNAEFTPNETKLIRNRLHF